MVDVVDLLDLRMRWTATASKPPISPGMTKDGLSAASDCMSVVGRMCSSWSRMVRPFWSLTGMTEFLK